MGGVGTPPPEGSAQHIELSNAAGRVWLAARLYHAGLAPRIIVSGGSPPAADGTALIPDAESIRPRTCEMTNPSACVKDLGSGSWGWEQVSKMPQLRIHKLVMMELGYLPLRQ